MELMRSAAATIQPGDIQISLSDVFFQTESFLDSSPGSTVEEENGAENAW